MYSQTCSWQLWVIFSVLWSEKAKYINLALWIPSTVFKSYLKFGFNNLLAWPGARYNTPSTLSTRLVESLNRISTTFLFKRIVFTFMVPCLATVCLLWKSLEPIGGNFLQAINTEHNRKTANINIRFSIPQNFMGVRSPDDPRNAWHVKYSCLPITRPSLTGTSRSLEPKSICPWFPSHIYCDFTPDNSNPR